MYATKWKKKIKSHVLNKLANNEQVLNGVRVWSPWEHTSTQTSLLSPPTPPPRISYHICCEVWQQTNSGNVHDQPGLSVPKTSLIWDFFYLFVCMYVDHGNCLDFIALESRPFWLQPINSELPVHSKGKPLEQLTVGKTKGVEILFHVTSHILRKQVKKFSWIVAIHFSEYLSDVTPGTLQ